MGRPPKWIADGNALCGWGPLRQYWQDINRRKRAATAAKRVQRKAIDQRRPKCRCAAYPWPHRPGGGLCRHPEPPLERWQPKPSHRPYRDRYAGLRRQIARANGLHPIRDREAIAALLPRAILLAKQLKQKCSRVKYRNIKITENGVRGEWQTAGPRM